MSSCTSERAGSTLTPNFLLAQLMIQPSPITSVHSPLPSLPADISAAQLPGPLCTPLGVPDLGSDTENGPLASRAHLRACVCPERDGCMAYSVIYVHIPQTSYSQFGSVGAGWIELRTGAQVGGQELPGERGLGTWPLTEVWDSTQGGLPCLRGDQESPR